MIYVDTSVVLAQLLAEDRAPAASLWQAAPLVTSRLLEYEVWSRINAQGLSASHGEDVRTLLARLAFLELMPPVLSRALEPFPSPVRALDALHLASIDFLRTMGQRPELATFDRRMAEAAIALGIPVAVIWRLDRPSFTTLEVPTPRMGRDPPIRMKAGGRRPRVAVRVPRCKVVRFAAVFDSPPCRRYAPASAATCRQPRFTLIHRNRKETALVRHATAAKRNEEWLALGPASRLVGVDPDTLRRWADEGRVEVYHTPGRHRRFQRGSLERLIVSGTRPHSTLSSLGATPQRLTDAYRRTYLSRDGLTPNPLAVVRDEDREMFRRNGRQLVDALMRYLEQRERDPSSSSLEVVTELSAWLGTRLASSGTSLTESVALFVAARRPFLAELGTLAKRRRLDSRQVARLFDESSKALDSCLLAFIDAHREAADSR